MDTVDILNHYRFPLMNSQDSIQLLARLLRDGPQQASHLAMTLKYEVVEVNRLLTALYRAALVEQRQVDLWAITNLGESLLEGLRIHDLASIDLAQGLANKPSDQFFIRKWIERPSDLKDSRTCLSLLRYLNQVQQLPHSTSLEHQQDTTSLLYAILIAADPWAQQTGIENIAEVIRARFQSRMLADHSSAPGETELDTDSVAISWRAGMRKYLDSNRILLFIPTEPPMSTDEETVQLTWMRALDAALGGTADQGFKASCLEWERDDVTVFWRFMFNYKSFEQQTRTLFVRWTGIDEPTTEILLGELTERLLHAVAKTSSRRTEDFTSNPATNRPDDFETLVSMMQHAAQRLDQEGIQVVPNHTQETLRSALADLTSALAGSAKHEPDSKSS
jgi:hypothetical protein